MIVLEINSGRLAAVLPSRSVPGIALVMDLDVQRPVAQQADADLFSLYSREGTSRNVLVAVAVELQARRVSRPGQAHRTERAGPRALRHTLEEVYRMHGAVRKE